MRPSKAEEIRADLRRRITDGQYRPGERLPRLADLMTMYSTRSRSAVDRALRGLEAEGLLSVIQGSGIYVRRRHLVRRDLAAGLHMEYQRALSGEVPGGLFETTTGTSPDDLTVTVTYDWIGAPDRVANQLGIPPGAPVLARTYRYRIQETPHQIARSYLPEDLARRAGLTGPDSERPGVGTIAYLHTAGATPSRATITLETRMPSADEAVELAIPSGTSVYDICRVLHSGRPDDRPLEVSTAVVPGDRVAYQITVEFGGPQ